MKYSKRVPWLKNNFKKRSIVGIHMGENKFISVANVLGYGITEWPMRCLRGENLRHRILGSLGRESQWEIS